MNNLQRLAALAYLFGVPALYITLTGLRKKDFIGYHGAQALYLWVSYFALIFVFRFLLDLIWHFWYFSPLGWLEWPVLAYMAGYAIYCALRALAGPYFTIPR